jgi:hypothetical protein
MTRREGRFLLCIFSLRGGGVWFWNLRNPGKVFVLLNRMYAFQGNVESNHAMRREFSPSETPDRGLRERSGK